MLTINSLSDSSGSYLLSDPAREVGDLFGGPQPGRWVGRSAQHHGLVGDVEPKALSLILSGRIPGGTLEPGAHQRRSAYDLVFAAPKPVSVLMASPSEAVARQVVLGHEVAVEAAMDYVEDRSAGIRRASERGERTWLHVNGVVAARFTHGTSRSGDPHLHSHVLLANRARGEDGRFGALDGLALRAHARATDAIYLSALRSEMSRRLEVVFQRGSDGVIRIMGVSDADCIAFSGRSEEVRRGVIGRPLKTSRSRSEALGIWEERKRRAPLLEDAPRFDRSARHVDEHRAGALLYGRPLLARHVVESVAMAATAGISAEAIATVLAQSGSALGRGIAEVELSSNVVPTWRALKELGPRPTDRTQLTEWFEEAGRSRDLTSRYRSPLARGR